MLTRKQNTSGSRSGQGLISTPVQSRSREIPCHSRDPKFHYLCTTYTTPNDPSPNIHAPVLSSDPQTPNIKISKHHILFLLQLGSLQSVSANPRTWVTFRNTYSQCRTHRSRPTPNGGITSRRLFATSYSTNLMISVSNGLVEGCTNPRSQITRATKLCTEEQNNCGSSVWDSLGVTTLALRTSWRVLDF
jgi:hypothetical protein